MSFNKFLDPLWVKCCIEQLMFENSKEDYKKRWYSHSPCMGGEQIKTGYCRRNRQKSQNFQPHKNTNVGICVKKYL